MKAVVVGLRKHVVLDEIEDDFTEIPAFPYTRAIEHGFGQGTVLLEGKTSQSFDQLRTIDMGAALRAGRVLLLDFLKGMIEPLANEAVGGFRIAAVLFYNEFNNL